MLSSIASTLFESGVKIAVDSLPVVIPAAGDVIVSQSMECLGHLVQTLDDRVHMSSEERVLQHAEAVHWSNSDRFFHVFREAENCYLFTWHQMLIRVNNVNDLYSQIRKLVLKEYHSKLEFWITVQGKLIPQQGKPLKYYNLRPGVHYYVRLHFGLMGGSKADVCVQEQEKKPLSTVTGNAATWTERYILTHPRFDVSVIEGLEAQADETTDEDERAQKANMVMWAHVIKRMQEHMKNKPEKTDKDLEADKQWVMCMVENVFQSYHWFMRCDNYVMWVQLV